MVASTPMRLEVYLRKLAKQHAQHMQLVVGMDSFTAGLMIIPGMALAIVRGESGRTGTATLRVSAEGLPAATADITLAADAGTAPATTASGTTP